MRNLRNWLVVATVAILPAALLVAALFVSNRTEDQSTKKAQASITMPVQETALDDARTVTFKLAWGTAQTIVSPNWSGTVTAIGATAGTALESGTKVVQIDGVWRLAVRSSAPMFAPVGKDSERSQRALGTEILSSLGYIDGDKGSDWDWDTTVAIRQLARDLGIADTDTIEQLDPAWFVWLPSGTTVVAKSKAVVGAPAPGAGTDVAELVPGLTSATIDEESSQSDSQSASTLDDGPWEFNVGGSEITLPELPVTDATALEQLGAKLGVEHPDSIKGKLHKKGSATGWTVPTTSIIIDRTGATCVLLVAAKEKFKSLKVETIPGGEPGVTNVQADARGSLLIISNPRSVQSQAKCS